MPEPRPGDDIAGCDNAPVARGRTILFVAAVVVVAAAAVVMATRLAPERVVIAADPGELGENLGIGPSARRSPRCALAAG
jgi:hypothetical protein